MSGEVREARLVASVGREEELTRRSFCKTACQAASIAALGPMLQSCSKSPTSPSSNAPSLSTVSGTVTAGVVSHTVDGSSPLNTVGGAALIRTSSGDFLAARTAATTVAVFTAICTHEACTIDRFQAPNFVCPCHGSQYSQAGTVQTGPATRNLREYPSQLSGSTLTFTL